MTKLLQRMSNAPVETWPRPLLRTQIVFIHQKLFGLSMGEAMEIAQWYEDDEAISFIKANMDLIGDKNGNPPAPTTPEQGEE